MKKRTYPSWDAAGHAARSYASPKPRVVPGPVGVQRGNPQGSFFDRDRTCRGCGFHECDCDTRVHRLFATGNNEGFEINGYAIWSNSKIGGDQCLADDSGRRAVMSPERALELRGEYEARRARQEREQSERLARQNALAQVQEHKRARERNDRLMAADHERHLREHQEAWRQLSNKPNGPAGPDFIVPFESDSDRVHGDRCFLGEVWTPTGKVRAALYQKGNPIARNHAITTCIRLNDEAREAAERFERESGMTVSPDGAAFSINSAVDNSPYPPASLGYPPAAREFDSRRLPLTEQPPFSD